MAGYLEITSNGVSYKGNNPSSKSWEDVIKPDPTILDVSLGNDDIIHYPTFVSDNSGNLPLYVDKSDTAMSYKPSTGELTATKFVGDLSGNVNNIYVGFIGNKATCVGNNSLKSNTGNYNTAIGDYALQNNTSGSFNTASGDYALLYNTSGSSNTATGLQSLYSNTNGSFNTASGANALLYNTSGTQNTASGVNALYSNTTGTHNTASGVNALYSNTTGTQNTATGRNALYNNTTGINNTALGYYSNFGSVTSRTYNNTTCLGYNSSPTGSDQVILGNTSANTYVKGGTVQSTSDLRDKTDVIDTQLGLNFINKLRPVDYKWDIRSDYNEIVVDGSSNTIIKHDKDGSKKRFRYHHGLIAQEVKSVMDELNIDFGGYQDHSVKGGEDQLTLGYSELIGPLIKAVQELSTIVHFRSNQT